MIYHSHTGYTLCDDDSFPSIQKTTDFKRGLEEHLKDARQSLKGIMETKEAVDKYVHKQDWSYKEQQDYLHYAVGIHIGFSVKMAEKRIENIERLIRGIPVKGKKKFEGTGDIQEARQVPISNFIEFNRMGFAVCPFHGEKTGSLKYYKKDNKAHCFGGCAKSFDVIDIVQKMNGYTLPQTIKFLTK